MITALIIALGVIFFVIVIVATQRSGPRVTHIETRRHEDDPEDRK